MFLHFDYLYDGVISWPCSLLESQQKRSIILKCSRVVRTDAALFRENIRALKLCVKIIRDPTIFFFFFTISPALFYMMSRLLKIRKTLKYTKRHSECGSENRWAKKCRIHFNRTQSPGQTSKSFGKTVQGRPGCRSFRCFLCQRRNVCTIKDRLDKKAPGQNGAYGARGQSLIKKQPYQSGRSTQTPHRPTQSFIKKARIQLQQGIHKKPENPMGELLR